MSRMKILCVSLIALFAFGACAPKPSGQDTAQGSAKDSRDLALRKERVEAGLLPATAIKGQPVQKMNMADRLKRYKVPGISVAVINNGVIEWAKGYGVLEEGGSTLVTTETRFQAASISKPVSAAAALHYVEAGKLDLDEEVNNKLVSWKVPENDFTKAVKVTLKGLVTHSAGLSVHGFGGYAATDKVPTLVEILDGKKPANSEPIRVDILPGAQWRYSGGGFTVMQQLLIDVLGKPFPDIMKETVLDKVGMTNSTYQQPLPEAWAPLAATGHLASGEKLPGKWHTYPEMAAAGLWTTPSDLARFAIEMQKAKAGQSSAVLSKEMATKMLTRQMAGWGLGIAVDGEGKEARFSHGGSNEGFRCWMVAYDETGQGAVVMTNSDGGSDLANEIVRSIAAEYGWPDYHVVERTIGKVDPEVLAKYAGRWEMLPGVILTLVAENGHLFYELPLQGRIELLPESETTFFTLENTWQFDVVKDEKGAAKEIVVKVEGLTLHGKKVK
jgi:CubicO group peptidase (beta-lactamase class C family)